MGLGGFGWIWLDLGADSSGFLNWILTAIEGFSGIIKEFGRIQLDLGRFRRI